MFERMVRVVSNAVNRRGVVAHLPAGGYTRHAFNLRRIAMKIVDDLRAGRDAMRSMPFWIKIVVSINCLLPGVAQWYVLKLTVFTSMQLGSFLELAKAALLFERHGQMTTQYVENGQLVGRALAMFGPVTTMMCVLGGILLFAMWYPTTKPSITAANGAPVST